jgi:hypothetical protein
MADESPPLLAQISSNHRRVISVRLRALEEFGLSLLQLFRPADSILTFRQTLPPEKAERVQRLVAEFTAVILQMKTDLGLERVRRDAAREAAALVAVMTVNVEELHPHYLKGYGKVPDGLADYLKVQVDELVRVLEMIEQALRKAESKETSDG